MIIKKAIDNLNKRVKVNLSMPGHKGKSSLSLKDDVTELPGLDNLYDPKGIIKESEDYGARILGVPHLQYMVNGSTLGNLAMVHGLLKDGDEIIVERNSHKSLYSALSLKNYKYHFIYNDDLLKAIGLKEIRDMVTKYPGTKAVFITSPNYMGYRADLKAIYKYLKDKGIYLLVDGAHGAHLALFKEFDGLLNYCTAMTLSIHKSLLSLNQGAVLVCQDEEVSRKLKVASRLFQTTSPSYLILESIEASIKYIEEMRGREINYFDLLKGKLGEVRSIRIESEDPFKAIVTSIGKGEYIFNSLVKEGIYPELHTLDSVLFMFSPNTSEEEIDYLVKILKRLDEKDPYDNKMGLKREESKNNFYIKDIDRKYTIKETLDMDYKEIELKNSRGTISYDFIIPYPPGIPLIIPGEVIGEKVIERLIHLRDEGIEVLGINEGKVKVVND